MRDLMLGLAVAIREAVARVEALGGPRRVQGDSSGGDAQFDIDHAAEEATWNYLRAQSGEPFAVYTEDGDLRETGPNPRRVLIIDPIDGTRPASAGLEMSTVSLASAPYRGEETTIADVDHALLYEWKSGRWMYSGDRPGIEAPDYPLALPRLSPNTELDRMFWSIEFNGHPMRLMTDAYAHLVDASANTGGVFVFNSASFSISRIITGQLDAYVDIGNRLLRDHPRTEAEFRAAGRGHILHLFPYDIAASVRLAEQAGVVITDSYGKPLGGTRLLDISPHNQQSCIAAANPLLHERILESVHWDPPHPRTDDRRAQA